MLEMCRADLARAQSLKLSVETRAHRSAKLKLFAGFMGSCAQLGTIFSGVYVFYDWNVMEPFTWMFCKLMLSNLNCCRVRVDDGRIDILHDTARRLEVPIRLRPFLPKKIGETRKLRRIGHERGRCPQIVHFEPRAEIGSIFDAGRVRVMILIIN